MRFLLVTSVKDLRRRLADPVALLIWIGIPLALGGLMGLVSGGDATPPSARIVVVDEDDSFLSGLISGGGGAPTRLGGVLEIERVDRETGLARIEAGDGSALLVLPSGFQEAVLEAKPAELLLITNPAQRLLPVIVREGLEILVEAVFYVQRLFEEPLRQIVEGPPEGTEFFADETIAALSIEINDRVEALGDVLFPPVLTVESADEVGAATSGGVNLGVFLLPGTLFMSLLFIAQGMSSDLWRERDHGTLRRAVQAPQPMAAFLGGKLIATGVLMAAVTAVGLAFGLAFFGVTVWRTPGALAWSTFAGLALLCLFLLLQTMPSTQRGGNILTTVVLFPLMMIGGSFVPFEAMPAWMASIGRLTPNGLAVVRLQELLFGRPEPRMLALSALGIAAPTAAAFWLVLRRVGGRFASA